MQVYVKHMISQKAYYCTHFMAGELATSASRLVCYSGWTNDRRPRAHISWRVN